jgi:hypothetical protein
MIMAEAFSRAIESLLGRTDATPRKVKTTPTIAKPNPQEVTEKHRQWFAEFAANEVMPLLNEVAASARRHGAAATCRIADENGHLAADLVIVPSRLPTGAKPPRLTIYAVDGGRPLMVEYTGTFPGVGATGGFGAEVDYDPIYPSQVEEKILDFVALAAGA